ncbi:MAG: hypothetical protein ACM3SQ_12025 [Betaproteobacteria bacterium]
MRRFRSFVTCALAVAGCGLVSAVAAAQTPAPPPDDTPSISVGATIFSQYTYTSSPQKTDADGNLYHPSSFDVTRSYININGKVSHLVSFRITPDIARVSNGDLELRLKYAFAQINFDQWMTKGSWARFGQQQTPLIDYQEGVYRYRFQGTTFTEREGYLTSSDIGASFHGNFPNNYGDVHVGIYNGEGYHAPEANNQPSFQIRGTLRPFAKGAPDAHGLRVTAFYDADNYVKDGEKKRALFETSFEHKYVNAAFDYLDTHDQKSVTAINAHGHGYSFWITPRTTVGLEGLIRYDHYIPNTSFDNQVHKRTIVGVAYWFPHKGNVSAAFLVDYDDAKYENITTQPENKVFGVHALINF